MSLRQGYQPRPCQFCGSRYLVNTPQVDENNPQAEKKYRVECGFCGAMGPVGANSDTAWMFWDGEGEKAPSMYGAPSQGIV